MIESYTFGSIRVRGRTYGNDIKIIRGRVVPEWWRASGHVAAVPDVEDVLAVRPAVFVLGTGSSGMLRPAPGLAESLERESIRLIVKPTREAVAVFNRLHARGEDVAAGFHLTC